MVKKDYVGIGIIGAGFARTTQIPAFRACAGARVVAIASAHRENAEAVAREFEIPFVGETWREVVAHEDVDLVSVVTPPVTHLEMTLAALDAGKSVLCEKPMAINALQCEVMREAASLSGALAHLDHELRFLPGRRRMREMIRHGEIGRVRHARFTFASDGRASAERAWDWWSDAGAGGGVLGAIGSHAVDSFLWLLDAEIREVFGSLATHVAARPDSETGELIRVTTDDEANMLVRFADTETTQDATGSLLLSVVEPGRYEHRVEIFGERGALRVEDGGALWHAPLGAGEWQKVEVERAGLAAGLKDSGWSRGFTEFAREIVAALREGRTHVPEAATFTDGFRIQKVLDAARQSHESGCRVTV
ncbi:MAG TPA: Gfo/Idh/MocA family oxidoreductase [Pyrinomonadaceae bacterium]|nr:Gfo/Idh/MocA family oxidoreductase [Pyrinomonadaceae bacterium]